MFLSLGGMHLPSKPKSIAIFQDTHNPIRAFKYLISHPIIMTLTSRLFFFNLFTIYFILIDPNFTGCSSAYGKLLNIIHHYFCSLLLFAGPLFDYYITNIVIIVFTIVGWRLYGRCLLTVESNRVCHDHIDNPFQNFPFQIKKLASVLSNADVTDEKISTPIDYGILILVVLYNLYMVYRIYF